MIRRPRFAALAAACLPLFALTAFAACGGDDDDAGPLDSLPTAAPTNTPRTTAELPTASPASAATAAATAVRTPTTAPLRFAAADKVIDAATKDYSAVIATAKGEITIKLFDDKSPNTVNAFVFLARKGFYNNITFHRVVSGFVAQAGDPTGTGSGGPGFETEQEANDYKNQAGYVSMARAAGSTKFGSQWFINLANNAALDQDMPNQARFYPFGQVTKGMDVVLAIRQGDRIQTITIVETPQGQ
ncbi:MAG: peptidylprolyl isomerase [Dehalococcoidia bacterium]